ncbi:alpha/beta fold hydrolase [Amycolatopsis sp. NPDC059657]|uniref:alpha/beta fold hydrolase n=1 Tax=Amycolatopsis sp. NPDC059657 TaxID=3346899 RepID=UPI0036716120
MPPDIRTAFLDAYAGPDALRCAFSYYRALPTTARRLNGTLLDRRLTMPTLAIGAHPVGTALEQQLRPITDDLTGHVIPDCGHIIPLDRPRELLRLVTPFLAADQPTGSRGHVPRPHQQSSGPQPPSQEMCAHNVFPS